MFTQGAFPAASKSHVLREPETFCKKVCQRNLPGNQAWLKGILEDGDPVYMVVALHTITQPPSNRDRVNTILGVSFLGMPFLPMGTSYAMGAPLVAGGNRGKSTLPGPDDKIVAIEYRQIDLRTCVEEAGSHHHTGTDYIEGEIKPHINVEDVMEVFEVAIEDGKGSIIVTPVQG